MASTQAERFAVSPATPASSKAFKSPLSDEAIWRRLREAGFDEESIKRRDKASLISYIAKLETEIYKLQNEMGLLIMEKKEWLSNYEQMKATAESAELLCKREQAAHLSALAEAKKREDSLKKALGIEKECVSNIEKALHEMRAEAAEAKVAGEMKLVEAHSMIEDAQKKFTEADTKLHAAESLEAEAIRYHRAAERKLHDVEAREDDLRRRLLSFKLDCDAKGKEILLERQSLCERQKTVQQSQERLLEGQALLNQREEYIFNRSQEISHLEKELEASKLHSEQERRALNEEKANLDLKTASFAAREEELITKERELKRKAEELLIQQETLATKQCDAIQQAMANHEAALQSRKCEFEANLEVKRKSAEEEIENKRRAWELREVELRQREDLIVEKEHDLEIQLRASASRDEDLTEKLNAIEEKEKSVLAAEREVDLQRTLLQKEKEEISRTRNDLRKSLDLLDDKRRQIYHAEEKVEAMKTETKELMLLETKLKEEIDFIRAQKHEIEIEADELKAEKAKFETEWESIDEKRKELQQEAERIAEERVAISKFLKDERDALRLEKDAIREQYRNDVESLARDRETFMSDMERERSEWFSKIQKERTDFVLDIEMQRKELENCIDKRREEIESYLRDQEKSFEEEKKKELQHISSLKETVAKETEQLNLELQRLDSERREINRDHERRDKEWAELNGSIEELKVQREKLEKQRELLREDRGEILAQIEQLKKLEDLKAIPDRIVASETEELHSNRRAVEKRSSKQQTELDLICKTVGDEGLGLVTADRKGLNVSSPSLSAPLSWLKRCADTLLEQTHSNKKRRQEQDITQSQKMIAPRALPTQPNTVVDEYAVTPAAVGAKETPVYIDKIITIREVTSADVEKVAKGIQDSDEKLEDHGDLGSDKIVKVHSDKTVKVVEQKVERRTRSQKM